ncbi:hypothetical protein Hanom_Chr16g01515361 [Helianthus anomalus]
MFVHLTKRTKFLGRFVCLINERTNTNKLPAERFTNCSPNVWFVCSPSYKLIASCCNTLNGSVNYNVHCFLM